MIHRPFNKSLICNDEFIKISSTERLADEIYYYNFLQQHDVKSLFAEFRGDVSTSNTYALKLKNYNHLNFYENLVSKTFDKEKSLSLLINKLNLLHNYKIQTNFESNEQNVCSNEKILIHKTETEFLKFIKSPNSFLDNLRFAETITINGSKCLHFEVIWPQIKKIIIQNYLFFEPSFIHGDFCFANILHDLNNDDFIFIDPRGSYHKRGCFGDKAYDYAKLLHSLSGNYEQIIYDKYKLEITNSRELNYSFENDFSYLKSLLLNKIDPLLFRKSKLIEGLLFISMCSRHYENEEHQLIMYCQGLLILNEFIKNQSNFSNH